MHRKAYLSENLSRGDPINDIVTTKVQVVMKPSIPGKVTKIQYLNGFSFCHNIIIL